MRSRIYFMDHSIPNDLKKKYLERRKIDLSDCQSFYKSKDFGSIEKIGHKMKGNGGTFGYPEISTIGGKIEAACMKKDEKLIQEALSELASWVKNN
jgi:HPt (histidine-containing phosphotransfer) domain-containing protein